MSDAASPKRTRVDKEEGFISVPTADHPPMTLVRQLAEIAFTGDLVPSVAAYKSACYMMCGSCTTTPCVVCKRPFHHRAVALQQPFESVMYDTPPLFDVLFSSQFRAVAYHNLVLAYSAVYVHLKDLINPDRDWMSPQWKEEARERRTFAWGLWSPYIQQHEAEIKFVFKNCFNPVAGRAGLISAYQKVIVAGLRAARAPTVAEFECKLDEEIAFFNGPLKESPVDNRLQEVKDFNDKHREWAKTYYPTV